MTGWKRPQFDRSGTPHSELQHLLGTADLTCRDIAELNRAAYILDVRNNFSETRLSSAEYVTGNTDQYSALEIRESALFMIGAYKRDQRYQDLIELSKRPHIRDDSETFVASRDSVVLSLFALAGDAHTLEMLRPLAREPVSTRDWWLMHFSGAIAERVGDVDLASTFRKKANGIFVPERPLELPDGLSGDLAERMLAAATSKVSPELSQWSVLKPPVPNYPNRAAERGVSGACDVVFDISIEGKPENVRSYCTSRLFLKEAARAIKGARFEHPDEDPNPQKGIVYPLTYTLGR